MINVNPLIYRFVVSADTPMFDVPRQADLWPFLQKNIAATVKLQVGKQRNKNTTESVITINRKGSFAPLKISGPIHLILCTFGENGSVLFGVNNS